MQLKSKRDLCYGVRKIIGELQSRDIHTGIITDGELEG